MGAPFGPKSHVWLVARVPDVRLIPERDRSVLAFYFYMSVEIIISRGALCRIFAGQPLLSIPPSPINVRKLAKNGPPRLDGLLRAAPLQKKLLDMLVVSCDFQISHTLRDC